MFEIISAISVSGNKCNEDAILCSDKFLVVVDGATGLEGIHLTDANSDASWLSNRICELLEKSLDQTDIKITDILKMAAKTIKFELDNMGYDAYAKASYPSASIAIVRQNKNYLECFTLGDAPIFLSINSEINCIYDDTVSMRDNAVIDKMIAIHKETGCSMIEARKEIDNLLLINRREMNQEGAYYIFEPSGAGIDNAIMKTILSNNVQFVSLMTDGFLAIESCYNIVNSHESLMKSLIEGKSEILLSMLQKRSKKDSALELYPRFKLIDDASVIVANNKII